MEHQAEMNYLAGILKRLQLKMVLMEPNDPVEDVDFGLRQLLGLSDEYHSLTQVFFRLMKPKTVYRLMDFFGCGYIFFALPGEKATAVIGPYMTADRTDEEVLETVEELSLPLNTARQLRDYYASLPVFVDTTPLMAMVSAMGETLWGSVDAFETIDLNRSAAPLTQSPDESYLTAQQLDAHMNHIKIRYDYENDMMDAVSKGLLQRVERITSHISQLNFEKRMADPLRNTKNYCIICNTLLRKAAERGGVHPVHIDRISSQYAIQIENKATPEDCIILIGEMFRAYCRLVRTHAISQYSVPVQKALLYMEENLSGELGLRALAEELNLAPGYLSGLFHRETGRTITEHINQLRMKHALHLLKTTQLQVQNVAHLCGIPDANYFGKLFRKQYGVTPRQYRQSLMPRAGE